jgi:hypothetical protein
MKKNSLNKISPMKTTPILALAALFAALPLRGEEKTGN